MIAQLRGAVTEIGLDHAVIDVGGVGFAVRATPSTLATLHRGAEATLATALVVREDSLTLFGFADAESRQLFELLQTVSGVGPRLALAMLAVLEPDTLRSAVSEGNLAVLTQVPGIGRKGAERLVIELRDKIGGLTRGERGNLAAGAGGVRSAVVEALVGLGFAVKQSEQAVDGVLADGGGDTSTVLRKALTVLGRNR